MLEGQIVGLFVAIICGFALLMWEIKKRSPEPGEISNLDRKMSQIQYMEVEVHFDLPRAYSNLINQKDYETKEALIADMKELMTTIAHCKANITNESDFTTLINFLVSSFVNERY